MHAHIITGGTIESRTKKITEMINEWRTTPTDQVILSLEETASIGIAQVRAFQKRLSLTPYSSPYTVGIIREMHTLTPEAQNALLKTLEEPPPHAKIVGETQSSAQLLPTVLSRSQLTDLGETATLSDTDIQATRSLVEQLQTSSIGKRLMIAQPLGENREKATAFIERAIPALEQTLRTEKNPSVLSAVTRATRALLTARTHLQANVTPRLAIDTFALSL